MCIRMYVCMYTYVRAYAYLYICKLCMLLHMHAFIHTTMQIRLYVCTYVHTYIRTCAFTEVRMYDLSPVRVYVTNRYHGKRNIGIEFDVHQRVIFVV